MNPPFHSLTFKAESPIHFITSLNVRILPWHWLLPRILSFVNTERIFVLQNYWEVGAYILPFLVHY